MNRQNVIKDGTPTADFQSLLSPVVKTAAVTALRGKERPLTPAEQLKKALEEARNEGFESGYSDGLAIGKKSGEAEGRKVGESAALEEKRIESQKEIETFVQALREVLGRVDEATERWKADCESEVAALAMEAIRKVLAAELSLTRESILEIVREALGEVTHSSRARIRMNPFDIPIIEQYRDQLLSSSNSIREIEIVEDRDIDAGCVVETDGGVIDARVETKLQLIENSIEAA